MILALAVALAAGAGAALRHVVDHLVAPPAPPGDGPRSPLGIFVVNVTGTLALGVLVGLHATGRLGRDPFTVAGTGLLGGYTTFSTFTWQVLEQVRAGRHRQAIAYAGVSVGLGLAAMVLTVAVSGA